MKQTCSIFMSKLPCLSRNFLESFASQIWIPFLHNSFAFVQPLTNQRSSSAIPCQNTCFVGRGDTLLHRLNLIWTPKMERVPVPEWYFVSPDTKLCFVLIVRFTYFISVVLKGIRSYPYVYCAIEVLKLFIIHNY